MTWNNHSQLLMNFLNMCTCSVQIAFQTQTQGNDRIASNNLFVLWCSPDGQYHVDLATSRSLMITEEIHTRN